MPPQLDPNDGTGSSKPQPAEIEKITVMDHQKSAFEKSLMAVPTLLVFGIMGTSMLHIAGDGLRSKTNQQNNEWIDPLDFESIQIDPPIEIEFAVDESSLFLGEEAPPPSERSLILGETPEIPSEFDLILGPDLPVSEKKARARVISWLGGREKHDRIEGDMLAAYASAQSALAGQGINLNHLDVIGVIDFSKPSYVKRFSIFHPGTGEESRHLVAHGSKSGGLYARKFSNRPGSHQSSLGLYRVGKEYRGKHGRSLRLHGLEKGKNDLAFRRAIVLHSASYVSYRAMLNNLQKEGTPRLGRSLGCPAVHQSDLEYVLSRLEEGTYLYIHTDT